MIASTVHADRLRLHPNESMALAASDSSNARPDVSPAMKTKKKKNAAATSPAGRRPNSPVIVTKSSPAPWSGSSPNANRAGNMTKPASTAASVSKATIVAALPGMSLFRGWR